MDIWEKLYLEAKALYAPQEISDFVYARHVVAAVEAADGQIFTGFCMEGTCGAISAAAVLAGLKISTADLEKPNSKGTSYKASKACIAAFKEKNSTIVCRELKGVDTGKVLRACPDCIRDAVAIIEENLFPEE